MPRKWLADELNNEILPKLRKLKNNAAGQSAATQLCETLRDDWAARGLTTAKMQQGCFDQLRRAIRDELGSHWTLDYLKMSRDEHFDINQEKAGRARDRQMSQSYISDPDGIVATAVRLLESSDWAEVTAGLAVLTGRRLNELLVTAEFTEVGKWILRFSGALKRRGEAVALVFDIPTLTTAKNVIEAVNRLRKLVPDAGTVNESREVAQASERHFGQYFEEQEDIYAHLWRSVYSTIACFWYCPTTVDDLLFKAHILGHFQALAESDQVDAGKLNVRLETFASDRHYRRFEIADSVIAHYNGKRKGIKLGAAGIVPLPAFSAPPAPAPAKPVLSTIKIWAPDKIRLEALVAKLGISQTLSSHDKLTQLLNWAEAQANGEPFTKKPDTSTATTITLEPQAIATPPAPPAPAARQPSLVAPPTIEPPATDPLTANVQALAATVQQLVQLQLHQAQAQPTPAPASYQLQPPAAPVQATEPAKKYSKRGTAIEICNDAIDQILAYNDDPNRSHPDKWAITIGTLKNWVKSQNSIYKAIAQRQNEIDTHHAKHEIDPYRHNTTHHRRKNNIKDILETNVTQT